MERLLTVRDVAAQLSVHHMTVRRLVRQRKIQSMRLSPSSNSQLRFKQEWIDAYIHSRQARAS